MTYAQILTFVLQIELSFCSISFNLAVPSPASCSVSKPSQFILVSIPRVTLPPYTVYLLYFIIYLVISQLLFTSFQ